MSNLINYARSELERAGYFDETGPYMGMLGPAVMKMVEVFAGEGHSGMSGSIALAAFKKVAAYQPLTPLTGEDEEWIEVGERVFQNKRCSSVFKDASGVYDIRGKAFREPDGTCFTSRDSRVPVTFPYTPADEDVDVPAERSE